MYRLYIYEYIYIYIIYIYINSLNIGAQTKGDTMQLLQNI